MFGVAKPGWLLSILLYLTQRDDVSDCQKYSSVKNKLQRKNNTLSSQICCGLVSTGVIVDFVLSPGTCCIPGLIEGIFHNQSFSIICSVSPPVPS